MQDALAKAVAGKLSKVNVHPSDTCCVWGQMANAFVVFREQLLTPSLCSPGYQENVFWWALGV